MAAGDTNLTMIGNLVNDPELRFTPSGAAVAKFTVASTPLYSSAASDVYKRQHKSVALIVQRQLLACP